MITRVRGDSSQDFELNLASIIDCFTVLIVFMLASAAFVSIGILEAGVAAAGASALPGTPPPVQVMLELRKGGAFAVKVSGKETRNLPIAASPGGTRDYASLETQLTSIKSRWPAAEATTVTADPDVEYQDIVKSMESARKSFPVVLLGGF